MYAVWKHIPLKIKKTVLRSKFNKGTLVTFKNTSFIQGRRNSRGYCPLGLALKHILKGYKYPKSPGGATFAAYFSHAGLGEVDANKVHNFIVDWDTGVITDLKKAIMEEESNEA